MLNDDELEAIRQRKLAELQAKQAEQARQERELIEAQKMAILRQILTEEARQRLSNIRLVKPQLAEAVELRLIQLAQQGAIREKITDIQLKEILRKIQGSSRKDTKIEIRRL